MDTTNVLALEYIENHNVLCLATSQNNQSWVAPVFYALHDGAFVFLSAPHTRHCQAIKSNPAVAASIQEDYKHWGDIKGVQLEGVVRVVNGEEKAELIRTYAHKFPVTGADAPPAIAKALDKISWFSLLPESLFFIDNSKGLGHRDEIDCAILQR